VACAIGNGYYNVLDAISGAPVMSSVSPDCLKQFGNFTIAQAGDWRCSAVGSPSVGQNQNPCGVPPDAVYKPVLACPGPGGYSIIDPATNTIIMSNVSHACLSTFKSLTISTASDPRCASAKPAPPTPPSIISNPGAKKVTFPIAGMQFPWSESAPLTPVVPPNKPIYDVAQTPPVVGQAPPPPPAPALPQPPVNYAPGQPIPVADWFGLCKQMNPIPAK